MEPTSSFPPPPAQLMRRMRTAVLPAVVMLSRDGAEPMLRLPVEANRGKLLVQLAAAPAGGEGSVQWTQNGLALVGQMGPALHLAGLTAEDGDVYYARLHSAAGETRSQAFLVVVMPGNPLLNVSARGQVTPKRPLIVGFSVGRVAGPIANRRYLLRAIGVSLRRLGVAETLANPHAALHRGRVKFRELERSDEQTALAREWEPRVGAFALDAPAAEVVAVVELPAGSYSLVVTGAEGETGEALAEVYEIPE